MSFENVYSGLANITASSVLSAYALENRIGNIRDNISKKFPRLGDIYTKISPTIEHFIWGFAGVATGCGLDDISTTQTYEHQNTFAIALGTFIVATDLFWESHQALKRKKILPGQFIGTCIGAGTALTLNNIDYIKTLF